MHVLSVLCPYRAASISFEIRNVYMNSLKAFDCLCMNVRKGFSTHSRRTKVSTRCAFSHLCVHEAKRQLRFYNWIQVAGDNKFSTVRHILCVAAGSNDLNLQSKQTLYILLNSDKMFSIHFLKFYHLDEVRIIIIRLVRYRFIQKLTDSRLRHSQSTSFTLYCCWYSCLLYRKRKKVFRAIWCDLRRRVVRVRHSYFNCLRHAHIVPLPHQTRT